MKSSNGIPDIFGSARDYRHDPAALEDAQRTFNEAGLYEAIAQFAKAWHDDYRRPARILDLCAATGWCALAVARAIPVSSATLVDLEESALRRGGKSVEPLCPVSLRRTDAVDFSDSEPYDLILMNSAYHHVEDGRKVAFLTNAKSFLASDGRILLGEHFLPPYSNRDEYRNAVVCFYERLIGELEARGEPKAAIDVIRRSGRYCWEGVYEYKVSWSAFAEHIKRAALVVAKRRVVWTHDDVCCENQAGSQVLILRPQMT